MALILVADDDEDIRELVTACLEIDGHQVRTANDGQIAWDALADDAESARSLQMLVVDRMMPGLSGMDVVRMCRADARFREMPIVMLTARALPDEIEEGLNEGADRYLTKPFSPRDLRAAVAELARHVVRTRR